MAWLGWMVRRQVFVVVNRRWKMEWLVAGRDEVAWPKLSLTCGWKAALGRRGKRSMELIT